VNVIVAELSHTINSNVEVKKNASDWKEKKGTEI